MMSIELYLLFLVTSVLFIISPGPNVLVIVGTSLAHGHLRGLQTVAGTSAAMIIQLGIAVFATTSFVSLLVNGFYIVKWLGVAYLVFLGLKHLVASFGSVAESSLSAGGSFKRGFFVSLTNPKTILFFVAFLPQFTLSDRAMLPQLLMLSVTFWCLAVALDSLYVLLASKAKSMLNKPYLNQLTNGVLATLYFVASALLALTRRSS
jgi:threonine/homoserine/homoserine lactone efflux protein